MIGARIRTRPAGPRVVGTERQRGTIGMMFIAALLVMFGFFGLALDLSQVYNRKMEMQTVADAVAVAAALELNGTTQGVATALQRASERFFTLPGTTVGGVSYHYSTSTMQWSEAAIRFGSTPSGPWRTAGEAIAQPAGLLYARVDTADLDAAYGEVNTLFMRLVDPELTSATTSAQAVAGRFAIKVAPIGICAMRPEAGRDHKGELEEYGFRRGVAYDLMQLNPDDTSEGQTFLINPMVAPGATGAVPAIDAQTAAPFVCTGTMAMARVTGGDIAVQSPFPLGELFNQLNSRFDSYTAPCNAMTAPPDSNIKEYKLNSTDLPWMTKVPSGQAAAQSTVEDKLWTVVGPDTTPTDTTAESYGPLWSYARAARFLSYTPGSPEPSSGYSTFGTSDWATLYNPGKPTAKSYPPSTPYGATSGTNFLSPANKGVKGRRVLNVPLLSCPVTGNRATVVGIGRFFMTVKADANHLVGEFAGLAAEQTLGSEVKLWP